METNSQAAGTQHPETEILPIRPDNLSVTSEMADRVRGNMLIFPNVVHAIADNIIRARNLDDSERLSAMRSVRDELIEAIRPSSAA